MSNATRPQIILVRAVQTCGACPSQWDAWDLNGRAWYLRYRHGHGTIGPDPCEDTLTFSTGGPLDGVISLEEFCEKAGVAWRPELRGRVTEFGEVRW